MTAKQLAAGFFSSRSYGVHRFFVYTEDKWDCVLLRKHFSDPCDFQIRVRQCENISLNLEFGLRKPGSTTVKGDPARGKDFKELFELIASEAKISCLNKCHFYRQDIR